VPAGGLFIAVAHFINYRCTEPHPNVISWGIKVDLISNTECPISNNEGKLRCWTFEIHYCYTRYCIT
jgi:hypothetical protein